MSKPRGHHGMLNTTDSIGQGELSYYHCFIRNHDFQDGKVGDRVGKYMAEVEEEGAELELRSRVGIPCSVGIAEVPLLE